MAITGILAVHRIDKISYIVAVLPGLTGLWQANGRSDTDYVERVRLDMEYIQNWSFWLDVKILLQTVPAVLRKRGAREVSGEGAAASR